MKEAKTIHAKMAEIKKRLSQTKIAKSGSNRYAGFKYHELSDFIAEINKLNFEIGVNDSIEIDRSIDVCALKLFNTEDSNDYYAITIPFSEAEMLAKGGAPSAVDQIQRLGSTVTYIRRYLYITAYNIQESDGVDSSEPQTMKPKPKLSELTAENVPKAIEFIKGGKSLEELKKIRSFGPEIEKQIKAGLNAKI